MEPDLLSRRLLMSPGEGPDAPAEGDAPERALRWLPDRAAERGPVREWLDGVRSDPGRAGVFALGAVGILAVLVTVFTVLRQPPAPVSANLPPVQKVSQESGLSSAPSDPAPAPVVVSVVGLVRKPGVVTLASGARIADAVDAAGGVVDGADLVNLNMARRVADGEQIVVGAAPVPGQRVGMSSSVLGGTAVPKPGPGPSQAPQGRVNLNTATESELDALPGIGPVMAASIVRWRNEHGKFSSIEQLSEVDGIGPTRLDKLRALVTL